LLKLQIELRLIKTWFERLCIILHLFGRKALIDDIKLSFKQLIIGRNNIFNLRAVLCLL